MKRGLLVAMLLWATSIVRAEEPAKPPAEAAAAAVDPPPPSVVMKEEGLTFDVPLNQRSLRERDSHFDQVIKGLPELDTDDVPFKPGWTEHLARAVHDEVVNGPQTPQNPAEQALDTRQNQMNGVNPEDDWTWTPPSR